MRRTSAPSSVRAQLTGVQFLDEDLGLSLYTTPPDAEVSVREFEEAARDRLRLLHAFDRLCAYDMPASGLDSLKPKLKKELIDANLALDYPSGLDSDTFATRKAEFARRDAISHFALRLAFCKKEARDWFLRQEQRLFMLRYDRLRPEAQEAFVKKSGLHCERYTPPEETQARMRFVDQVQHVTAAAKVWHGDGKVDWDNKWYTMPFHELDPNLISSRKVVLKGGVAFVPSVAIKYILAKRFKDMLAASLDVAFQGHDVALAEPRIGAFLRNLQEYGMQLLVAPKSANTEEIGEKLSTENFELLLARSFPPCMRRLVEQQREMKKHLKHAGRLQLRPFLKECGFGIEDSFRWWKQELTRDSTVDAASFEKNYTYDLEHTYGKKGHLQGQNCFGCPKVIGFPAESSGQVHGCVFKNLEGPQLRQQMHRWRVPEEYMMEIEKLVKEGKHYQLACIEYFKATHPSHTGDGVGNSPLDFFRESCRHHTKKHEAEADGSPAPPLAVRAGA